MLQKIAVIFLLLSLGATAFSQTAPTVKPTEADAKLTKDAVELLRETSDEVGRLRLPENRVSFNAELAGLMWFYDEKEARTMYGSVISDFRQLLMQLDDQANAPLDEEEDASMIGGFFGGYARSKVERKFLIAVGVREQIAMSLAEHAPDLAFNFYDESRLVVGNPKLKETDRKLGQGLRATADRADLSLGSRQSRRIRQGITQERSRHRTHLSSQKDLC